MTNPKKEHLWKNILSSAVVNNPVLFEAVGLSPLLAMTISLKSSIILTVASCIELVVIELFSCFALKKLRRWVRMPIYALLGVLLNMAVFTFFNHFTPNETLSVGIFLPLIAVNSLISLHCERFAVKHNLKDTLIDAVFAAVGYTAVILLIGILREMLGNGSFYGLDLHFPIKLKGMLLPFGAFLLLGFFAAAVQAVLAKVMPDAHPEKAFKMQEISDSHLDSFRALLSTDFNPYADGEDEPEAAEKPKYSPKERVGIRNSAENTAQKPKKNARTKKRKKAVQEKQNKTKRVQKTVVPKGEAPVQVRTHDSAQRDSYLLDFDEILSDLDAYKQKQKDLEQKAQAEQDTTVSLGTDNTEQKLDTEKDAQIQTEKGGDEK